MSLRELFFQKNNVVARRIADNRRKLRDFSWLWAVSPTWELEKVEIEVDEGESSLIQLLECVGLAPVWAYSRVELSWTTRHTVFLVPSNSLSQLHESLWAQVLGDNVRADVRYIVTARPVFMNRRNAIAGLGYVLHRLPKEQSMYGMLSAWSAEAFARRMCQ